ncbi:MAG: MBL fold metallo-hydrolase [Promethearchaeota archaeon]
MMTQIVEHENGNIIEWKWASDNELIPAPFFTSVYFIDGILIDAGAPGGVNDFREFIQLILKRENGTIKACVITHAHEDHCGGAWLLQEEFKIPILAHELAIEKLEKEYTYPQYRQIAWGKMRLPVKNVEILPEILTSKSKKYTFELIPMPGHAPEQVALIEKKAQWVFVADAIQPKYKMLFGGNSDIQEDISMIYDSIERLYNYTANLNKLKIFMSRSGVQEGREFLKEKLDEIKALHLKVHQAWEKEAKHNINQEKILRKVLKNVFGKETMVEKLSNGDLSTMNLVKSLLKWELTE